MQNKSRVVLPFLVPRLIEPPITAFNAKALAQLTVVAGGALNAQLTDILHALLEASKSVAGEDKQAVNAAANAIARSVDEVRFLSVECT